MSSSKVVLILGANSDVAKELIKKYIKNGYFVIAASRNINALKNAFFADITNEQLILFSFDATGFQSHQNFYDNIPKKPNIVIYAAGFLTTNEKGMSDWYSSFEMIKVNYAGAVSILNIITSDPDNKLERIIGISSLSGVRGRKSNFIYGSTKAAFTQYLAGLRQLLANKNIIVNVVISGYIDTKINQGLKLNPYLLMSPEFVASEIFKHPEYFKIIPSIKWKFIYHILRLLPEKFAAKLP